MKKRFTILVSPNTLNDAFQIEQVFIACCVLHNRLIDYNGGDTWSQRMVPVSHQGNVENVEPTGIPNDFPFYGLNTATIRDSRLCFSKKWETRHMSCE
jgi:hypothetical protein